MKLIRILAFLTITIFLVEVVRSFIPGFINGWNEADDSHKFRNELLTVSVRPTDSSVVNDSLLNLNLKKPVAYTLREINTKGENPSWYIASILSCLPLALFALYGFYCLIRVVISVTRGDVFNKLNVRRMRFFIYSTILMGAFMETLQYFLYREWASQIVLNGYEVTDYSAKYSWLPYLTIALFTEIFAVGVKIKEEQDLTI